jgi:hypothetical protein
VKLSKLIKDMDKIEKLGGFIPVSKIDYRTCFMCGKQYNAKTMVNVVDDIWYCDRDYKYVCNQANEGGV